jgi:PhzF family phenazine biosynthesis protein
MKIRIYQVDAFTDKLFSGNPAAICPLSEWLPDEMLQNIAMENNLAETGFYVQDGDQFLIRWFTPAVEVNLCGHATLAASHVLFNHENYTGTEITFHSPRSGILKVTRNQDLLTLNFPTDIFEAVELTNSLTSGFNIKPVQAFKGKDDYMLVFRDESEILNLHPDLSQLANLSGRGVIATARGETVDFVSRWFGPGVGIDEDPVTGSAHTTLTPYWTQVLGKDELTAIQLSSRKGHLTCRNRGNRVEISGKARTYLIGEIETA